MNTISPTSSSLLEITILADNDFYSQREEVNGGIDLYYPQSYPSSYDGYPQLTALPFRFQLSRLSLPLTTASLRSLKPFASTHSSLKNVHKTGLGSSAAMITSLVGCLLSYLGVVYLSRTDDTHYTNTNTTTSKFNHQRYSKDLIHNIAQFCHCLAQGKIGSGFDVSSAVYGSHRYTRFSHSVIEHLLVQGEKILGGGTGIGGGKAEAAQFYKELANVVDPNEKR